MSLQSRITLFAEAVGADIKTLLDQDGSLTNLNTVDKSNLVNAINEVLASTPAGALLATSNLSDLNDLATARTNLDVYSTGDVDTEISTAVAAVTLGSLGGLTQAEVDARVQVIVDTAPAALDTLKELADALGNDANFAATMTTALGNKVDFTVVQTLTAAQQLQACENIGVGNYDHDFALDYTTERDA